ncbi:gliding motility-associated C-terminal domain-containing protein [Arundinibacter roseus]|uniref:Gliding motility-associated C-terminal domain-containing protein n=1 Tax=Arundinibacter roseus TaxID=2070510 RepID=A0A4R4K4D5_9BACT|nr:gliding motility-associated C-terminal domain-containing protein [Arundinibacter roseus]TDB62284.1 gliding motility-associated C-terminal domain-containing protein [Arundinibacter roseus]
MKSKRAHFSYVLVTLLLLGWVKSVQAQCPTALPFLDQYERGESSLTLSGCLPLTVEVRNQVPEATNIRTVFDYQGGNISPQNLSNEQVYRYPKTGSYTLIQLVDKENKTYVSCHTVEVTDTIAPVVRAVPCADGGVQLIFDANQPTKYPTYQVDWGDTEIKGYPSFRRIQYKYASPATYTIRVRGVHTPGQCRGSITQLTYVAPESLSPPVITEGRAADEQNILLSYEHTLPTDLILLRGSAGGTFEPAGNLLSSSETSVATTMIRPEEVCFQLQPADSCLSSLRSKVVCAAEFAAIGSPDSNTLTWKIPDHSTQATARIERDNASWRMLAAPLSESEASDQTFVCGQNVCYQLIVSQNEFSYYSPAVCVQVPEDQCVSRPPFFMPEAFSPNHDGINDALEIKGVISPEFEIQIFNAWGTPVFYSRDPAEGWDGTVGQTPAPAGVYAYSIRFLDRTGNYATKSGSVLLVR